jgi:type II secretory pathway pseudopilin PulG
VYGVQRVTTKTTLPAGHRCRAFTTVELLTVVGILVVLATISVIGFRYVGDRTKGNTVRITLETLKGLTQEAEAAGAFSRQPPGVWEPDNTWVRIDPAMAPYANNQIPDFWRRQDVSSTVATSATAAAWSPGSLRRDQLSPTVGTFDVDALPTATGNDWRDAPAIKNTAIALGLLRNIPGPAKTLDSLPNSVAKLPVFWSATATYTTGSRVLYRATSNGTVNGGPMYVYVAARNVTAGSAPVPGTDTADWRRDAATINDGFGHPILFVPASGMHVGAAYVSSRSYDVGDRVFTGNGAARTYYECIAPAGAGDAPPNGTYWRAATPVRSPDGKPFWASAGPDGNFDTPGDNLYSFEN